MRSRLTCHPSYHALLAVLGVLALPPTGHAQQSALPRGGKVVSGGVTIGPSGTNGLTITQKGERAIVNWDSFSIGQQNSVTFRQPGASSAILNRVTGATSSTIAGQLNADGQVFLVNPNGISITPSGTVKVGGGFVASTLRITDSDFMSGALNFLGGGASATVSNAGSISAAPGGFVSLLGGHVSNSGTISVPLGRVGLGSGERATLDLTGDGFLQVAVPTDAVSDRALAEVSGRVRAPGGRIEVKAATVRKAIRDAVHVSGKLSARSISGRDGAIVLGGGDGGAVRVNGALDAGGAVSAGEISIDGRAVEIDGNSSVNAASTGGKGGDIAITATDTVTVKKASIDASGVSGGGRIRIGGDVQGTGVLGRAQESTIGADASIVADATESGDGGKVIVWSDAVTAFAGTISARGGPLGGDGGFAEVSGKAQLAYSGLADLSATNGRFGTLLLDPYNVTISNEASSNHTGFVATGEDSVIQASQLIAQLELANVTVSTGAGGSQDGNITVAAPVSWSADTVLTLEADGNIFINAPITATGTNAGLALNPGGYYTLEPGAAVTLSGTNATFSVNGNAYTLIHDVDELQAIQNNLSGRYALAVDIDAHATAGWDDGKGFAPIGTDFVRFSGVFDGLGHTISGLTINRPGDYNVGLFGVINGATISNVGIADAAITGYSTVGGVAGASYNSSILTSHVTGSVAAEIEWGNAYAGGLVGWNYAGSVICDSYSEATVTGERVLGGLVGENNGTIRRSYANGDVTGIELAGGLVGSNVGGTISMTYASGDVSTIYGMAGGLVANLTGGTIEDSYAIGSVSGISENGGLVGIHFGGSISRSYATGQTAEGAYSGGLVGYHASGSITNSYWDAESTGFTYTSGGGTKLTTAQAFDEASYANWDFANTWVMLPGTRPFLRFEHTRYITNAHQLQLMSVDPEASYVLAHDIDASATAGANASGMWGAKGFSPIGDATTPFSGSFDGQGHTIYGLTIDRPLEDRVGLFGTVDGGTISNVGVVGSVTGRSEVGGLAGTLIQGVVTQTYADVDVTGTVEKVGGLVGWAENSSISKSYATGEGSGGSSVGGLIGRSDETGITQSYARGDVSGTSSVGGLVGSMQLGSITETYATGSVTGSSAAGGLVGSYYSGTVSASYWDTLTSGLSQGFGSGGTAGAVGLTTTQMQNINEFATNYAGWDFSGIWVPPNQAGQGGDLQAHYPELYALSRAVAVVAEDASMTYGPGARPAFSVTHYGGYDAGTGATLYAFASETVDPAAIIASVVLADPNPSSKSTSGYDNAGAFTLAATASAAPSITSSGEVYRLVVVPGTFTVTPAELTVTATGQDKIYDGTTSAVVTFGDNRLGSDQLTVNGVATFGDANVGTGKTVNVTGITINGIDAANYTVNSVASASASITPRPITVTADAGQSKIYGESDPTLTYTIGGMGLVLGDTLTGSLGRAAGENVGDYAITQGTLAASTNYTLSFTPGTIFAITPRPITVTADTGQSKIYGESDPTLAYTIGGMGLAFGDTLTGALERAAGENVSDYAITQGSLAASGNYTLSFVPGTTFVITPRPITVTADAGQSKIYGESDPTLTYTIGGMGLAFSDTLTGALERAAGENVGDYAITQGTLAASGNYTLSFVPGTTFAITPRPITVTADVGQSKIYGESDPTLTYTIGGMGLAFGDTLTGVLGRAAGENVGDYAITQGTLAASGNYTLSFVPGTTFAITPRPITVTADTGQSKIYGESDPTLTYTIDGMGLVFGDTLTGSLGRAAGENVGDYAITQGTLAASSNYTLSFVPGTTFAITPRPITVTADAGQSKIYSESDPTLTYTIGGMGLAFGDTLTGSLGRAAGENVGDYAITQGTLAASGNYTLSFVPGTTFAITPRPITVTADAGKSKIYGEPDPILTYQIVSGTLVGGDTFTGALARTPGENVGSYDILQGTLSLGDNYALTLVPGTTFAITPRPITVTADAGQSKIYGNTDPILTYTIGGMGLAFGDTLTGSLGRTAGENVGDYTITQGTLGASANYALSFTPGTTFAITPRPITVTADAGQSKIYGNADPLLTYTIGGMGLAFGDTLTGSLGRAAGENVGSYAITQGTLAASGNYTLAFTPGATFAITRRALIVTARDVEKMYDGVAFTGGNGVTYSGFAPGETEATLSGTLVYGGSAQGAIDPGTYTLSVSGLMADNYAISYVPGVLVINAALQHMAVSSVTPASLYQPNTGIFDDDAHPILAALSQEGPVLPFDEE